MQLNVKRHDPVSGNRLKGEKSPYLLQHADNPVDWYPWGEEAMGRARAEDKPLLVSIGYSSCHWCHVMERESFEDGETARLMNENFVNVKVDREERPDVDRLYMKAVQAMKGQAGWPLTVFVTPEGEPFYGGSYFPPEDVPGLPSFKKVLKAVSEAYAKDRGMVGSMAEDIKRALSREARPRPVELSPEISDEALRAAGVFFDPVGGGFGTGAKFPHAMFLKFLILYYNRTGRSGAASMVKDTLAAMAFGGVYDHLGGGFHRYAVDDMWEVPHFEKMLYDNALLVDLYALFYDRTGAEFFRDVASESAGFLMREMRSPEGGFYASLDADSPGGEGAFYVWTLDEVKQALGPEDGSRFARYFSVDEEGNYEGANTLRVARDLRDCRKPLPLEIKALKRRLLQARARKSRPGTDGKVITAWNALVIKALVQASKSLSRPDLLEAASRCARFLLDNLRDENGRLLRYYLNGAAGVKATLEDYAIFAGALLSLFEATGREAWLGEAAELAGSMVELFHDLSEGEGLFFDTGRDQEELFLRERDTRDTDLPSGNSAAADTLLRLWMFTRDEQYRELAEGILASTPGITEEPVYHGDLLCVLESLLTIKENWKGVEEGAAG